MEVRPENGVGHYYEAAIGDNGYLEYQQATCACIDWQWNGAMHATRYQCIPRKSVNGLYYDYYDAVADGTLKNNLLEGEFISVENSERTITRQFTRGVSNQYVKKTDNEECVVAGTVNSGSIDFVYAHISSGDPGFFWW